MIPLLMGFRHFLPFSTQLMIWQTSPWYNEHFTFLYPTNYVMLTKIYYTFHPLYRLISEHSESCIFSSCHIVFLNTFLVSLSNHLHACESMHYEQIEFKYIA